MEGRVLGEFNSGNQQESSFVTRFWRSLKFPGKVLALLVVLWIANWVLICFWVIRGYSGVEPGSPTSIAFGFFAFLPIAIIVLVVSADKLAVYGVFGGVLIPIVQVAGAFADWRTGRSASFSFRGMDPLCLAH